MINIIPQVNSLKMLEGSLIVNKNITINNNILARNAILLLSRFFNVKVNDNPFVSFISDDSYKIDGSYMLKIDDNIKIRANSSRGFLYAIESLRQILPSFIENNKDFESVTIDRCIIDDYPRYSYRGYMIDSCRHFFNKEIIKEKLDQMAMIKLNKLHFHLSDDQGFRVDFKKYPKLKEIGSIRKTTKIKGLPGNHKSDVYDNKIYEGIYSEEDIKEIVEYANLLDIDIIPEIDSPGHLIALLASYPEYTCFNHNLEVTGNFGIFKDILCIGNEKAVSFVYDVIYEIAKMFPSHMIHIGGDEAPLTNISKCPKCLAKMKELGFKKPIELKLDYSNKLANSLIEKGYQVIGWNEIVNDNYPKDAIIQLWTPLGSNKAIKDINKNKRKVIVSRFYNFYLDYAYGMFPLKKSYNFEPTKLFKKEAKDAIIGVESPAWAEWIDSKDRLDWQTYPRLLATSETAWTNKENKNYKDFLNRVDIFNERLDRLNVNHSIKECYLYGKKYTLLSLYTSKDSVSNIEYNRYNKKGDN